MKIIALLNEKGGVGKTSLATHIAAGLACKGQRVLLADVDPQGHATVGLGIPKQPGVYDLLVRDALWSSVLRPVPPEQYAPGGENRKGELWLLPSNVETRNVASSISDVGLFRYRLDEMTEAIDVMIVDTPPTPSLLHGSIYIAADGIIYPTETEFLSLDGLQESLTHLDAANGKRIREHGLEAIKIMGIQPVMVEPNTRLHGEYIGTLRKEFHRLVWPALPNRITWGNASARQMTLFRYVKEQLDPQAIDPLYERSEGEAGSALREAWALVNRVEGALAA